MAAPKLFKHIHSMRNMLSGEGSRNGPEEKIRSVLPIREMLADPRVAALFAETQREELLAGLAAVEGCVPAARQEQDHIYYYGHLGWGCVGMMLAEGAVLNPHIVQSVYGVSFSHTGPHLRPDAAEQSAVALTHAAPDRSGAIVLAQCDTQSAATGVEWRVSAAVPKGMALLVRTEGTDWVVACSGDISSQIDLRGERGAIQLVDREEPTVRGSFWMAGQAFGSIQLRLINHATDLGVAAARTIMTTRPPRAQLGKPLPPPQMPSQPLGVKGAMLEYVLKAAQSTALTPEVVLRMPTMIDMKLLTEVS